MSTREETLAQVEKDAQLDNHFILRIILSALVAAIGLLGNKLAVNIVCINLASKLVFLLRGIQPRNWLEARKAKQSRLLYIVLWVVMLLLLILMIYLRHRSQT